jgi:hypothetical protein
MGVVTPPPPKKAKKKGQQLQYKILTRSNVITTLTTVIPTREVISTRRV